MFKKLNKKGFTLAELLVVVAIIGVLVAISIPIFTAQLEKARDAVTLSNVRAAYAEASAAYLTDQNDGTHVTVNKNAKTATVTGVVSKGTSTSVSPDWSQLPFTLADAAKTSLDGTPGTYKLVFTFDETGATSAALGN